MKLLEHWLPPDGAGRPAACLATSFTFDVDFFTRDCLARFLRLTGEYGERDQISDIAQMVEEEERLAEARVAVLVDRSCKPDPRNLRWDLLQVHIPGGLLHAKVAVLIWEHACRFLIGSANLTPAGYRRQVEIVAALTVEEGGVPRGVLSDLVDELRSVVALAPGSPDEPGPKRRALEICDLADARIATSELPTAIRGMKFAIAASRPGISPLSSREDVWQGPAPRSLTAMAPFWDTGDDQPAAQALLGELAQRSTATSPTTATFVVPVDSIFGGRSVVLAPAALRSVATRRIKSTVHAWDRGPDDDRLLHAKCLLYESEQWLAAMIGSSNVSAKGLGLDARPHRELNLWIGCRAESEPARHLRALIGVGPEISADADFEAAADEDEDPDPPLPLGFAEATLVSDSTLRMRFDARHLPANWRVLMPHGRTPVETQLVDSETWARDGSPAELIVGLTPDTAPSAGLYVYWYESDGLARAATWIVNVGDLSLLPPATELRDLPAAVLLQVLASTRPIREAVEQALRSAGSGSTSVDHLDPLRRIESSGYLMQRVRRASNALSGLERSLTRPIPSLDVLEWRLSGAIGPITLAERLVAETKGHAQVVGETQFLLAELAMVVHGIPWTSLASADDVDDVVSRVDNACRTIEALSAELGEAAAISPSLASYVAASFRRCLS